LAKGNDLLTSMTSQSGVEELATALQNEWLAAFASRLIKI
jgi:hypothetical protein